MFYDSIAISTLVNRIGWAAPIPPSTITISSDNAMATAGRYFDAFHRLAVVENVYEVQPQPDADMPTFQAYLQGLKQAVVRKVLNRIFDSNERAYYQNNGTGERTNISGIDYSSRIVGSPALFDDAIGYQMAYDVLELIASAVRSNRTQRITGASYELIKAEQDGYTDENGKPVDRGINGKLSAKIREINNILFPESSTPARPTIYNASNRW